MFRHDEEREIMDLKRQASAPLYEAIETFRKKRIVPFDVPGHKRGRGNPELVDLLGERCVGIDVNSMKPLDNLCHPVSVIKEAEELLKNNDILVTKRRNYYIETIYDHYVHTLYPEPLDETRKIIEEKCPEYLPAFDKHMKGKTMHAFNMFVMKKEYFDAYCEWLFDILFELTKRFEGTEYNSFHARYPGRISELLLDVWMNENGYAYKEVPFVYMEKIDMFKKGMGFLKAKFLHKKYGESF